jgi:hypothetical protein
MRLPLGKQADVGEMLKDMHDVGLLKNWIALDHPPSFWSGRRMGTSTSVWTTEN